MHSINFVNSDIVIFPKLLKLSQYLKHLQLQKFSFKIWYCLDIIYYPSVVKQR